MEPVQQLKTLEALVVFHLVDHFYAVRDPDYGMKKNSMIQIQESLPILTAITL
jgi:hypothetical protein